MCIIDWELAHLGPRSYDLGQLIGDFYERKHFKGVDSALWTMEAFVDGYGPLSEDMAFRIAIHAGVHLICWCNRRPGQPPPGVTPEQISGVVETGRDFVLKGWAKDKIWFQDSPLACLFKSLRKGSESLTRRSCSCDT
jgi:hypothetical protein